MRATTVVCGALLAGSLAGAWAQAGQKDWTQHMGGLAFVIGPKAGLEEAKFTGRAPMYFFTSHGNEICEKFGTRTWTDVKVREAIASYTPVLVDIDEHKDFAKQQRVGLVPSVVWLRLDGEWILETKGDSPLHYLHTIMGVAKGRAPEVEPSEEYKALLVLAKRLGKQRKGGDEKKVYATVLQIRKARLGRAIQDEADAADDEIMSGPRARIEKARGLVANKKRVDALKILKKLVREYAWHPVGEEAKAALEEIRTRRR